MTTMELDFTYYPYVFLSLVAWLVVYKYISPTISSQYFPAYRLLTISKQIDWNTRVNSSLHALIVSSVCVYVLLVEDEVSENPVWADSSVVKYNCAIVVGYLISDCLLICVNYKHIGDLSFLWHHLASMYAFIFVMTYGSLPWFANFRLLAELSTPFVNQRWFLDTLGYQKSSQFFMINGIVMTLVFFFARIVVMPPYWLKVHSIYGTPAAHKLGRIWFVLISSCMVLDLLNVYWFYKIFRGAQKVLKSTLDKNRNSIDRKAA